MNSERLFEIRTLRSRWALSHFNKHYKHRTEEFWLECSAILHNNKYMPSRQPMRIESPTTWSEVSQWEGGRSINPGQQTAGFEYRFQSWHLWLLKQNELPGKALFWVYCQSTDSQVKYWVFFPRKIFQKSRLITTTRTSLGGARLTVILLQTIGTKKLLVRSRKLLYIIIILTLQQSKISLNMASPRHLVV